MEQHIAHRVRRHDGRLIVGEKRGNTLRKSPSRGREKGAQGTEKKGNKEGKRHATTTDHEAHHHPRVRKTVKITSKKRREIRA